MKIVVMSDTHLYRLTDEFMEICDRFCNGADMVIHLGDWVSAPILDYLEQFNLEAVAGNMDNSIIHGRLPSRKILSVAGFRIGLVHGWGSATDLRRRLLMEFPEVDAIFFGHSHQPLCLRENGLFWFNPGSVFSGRGDIPRSLGIIHIQEAMEGEIIAL
jgi:putative phosphoesterase